MLPKSGRVKWIQRKVCREDPNSGQGFYRKGWRAVKGHGGEGALREGGFFDRTGDAIFQGKGGERRLRYGKHGQTGKAWFG